MNFVDIDALEASCVHMSGLRSLSDLYLTGNPCTDWDGYRPYVLAMVPQLGRLDGEDVTRTERIRALQRLPALTAELRPLAAARRDEKASQSAEAAAAAAAAAAAVSAAGAAGDDEDESSPWCPEERVKIAREVAAQKAEDDKKHDHMRAPERDYAREHRERLEEVRAREDEEARAGVRVRARNEAKLDFSLVDEDGSGNVVLKLELPRFLDSSLVDVDAHPGHVSIVVRGKLFRLAWPEEVVVSGGRAQRSSATGALTLTMPKARQSKRLQRMALEEAERRAAEVKEERLAALEASGRMRRFDAPEKLADAMLASAGLAGPVDVANIVDARTRRRAGLDVDESEPAGADMEAVSTRRAGDPASAEEAAAPLVGKAARLSRAAKGGSDGRIPLGGSMSTKRRKAPKKKKTLIVSGLIQELTGLDAELGLDS